MTQELSVFPPEVEKAAQALFQQPVRFVKSVPKLADLPDEILPEIAFAGRSNVGKSSLLNALCQQGGLARSSKTPGRTQFLNFFQLGDQAFLVDMPGYGYAEAPHDLVKAWTHMIRDYLKGRCQLKRVFLLIDSRHGVKKNDTEIMEMLDKAAVSYQIILTKMDKVSKTQLLKCQQDIEQTFEKHPALHPEILSTSSQDREGFETVRRAIYLLLQDFV